MERDEDAEIVAETIVVTADAPGEVAGPEPGVIVLEVDDLRAGTDASLADAVEEIPGITVQRTGSRFESSSVRIRGSSGEQVLVLRNGVPLADGRSSVVDLSRISLAGVERMEVVLGPATAIYGLGGAAGAINLITASGPAARSGVTGSTQATWGSFGEYRLDGTTTVTRTAEDASHAVEVAVDGVYSQNTYRFERGEDVTTRDNAGGIQGGGSVAYTRDAAVLNLSAEAAISAFERGLPGTVEFPSNSATLSEERLSGRLGARGGNEESLTIFGDVGTQRVRRAFRDDDYPLGALRSDATYTGVTGTLGASFTVASIELTLPVSWLVELLRDEELGDPSRGVLAVAPTGATTLALPGESEIALKVVGRVEVENFADATAAADEEGTVIDRGLVRPSARGSVGWTAASLPIWTGVAVSAGYRLPDFSELYTEGAAFSVGNPDLKPEESVSYEWELRVGDRSVQPAAREIAPLVSVGFRTALFYTEYRELIQWLPDPTGYWRPRNTGKARSYGVETDAAVGVPIGLSPWTVDLTGGVDVLQARDRTEGVTFDKQLPYRPQLTFRGDLGVEHFDGHRVYGEVRGRGARPITRQNTVWLDPYIDLSVGAAVAVAPDRATVSLEARNLLDERYVETRFYPNPGREFRVALEVVW